MKVVAFILRTVTALTFAVAAFLLALIAPLFAVEAIHGELGKFAGGFFILYVGVPTGCCAAAVAAYFSFRRITFRQLSNRPTTQVLS